MLLRQWYPQLDIYDTIRRMAVLLRAFETPPGVERLCIADFFLATPQLLHKTKMSLEVRTKFRSLEIIKPEKSYVVFPASQLFFHKMETIQNQALTELRGRDLVDFELFAQGKVTLTSLGLDLLASEDMCMPHEADISLFLAKDLLAPDLISNTELRNRTGLHRMI